VASDSSGVFDVLITDSGAPDSVKVELAGRFSEIR
jgi:hypothetical protein